MFITVAICTWNRAKLLDATLARFREIRVPAEVTWELLVVNNNCSDLTDEVIARHAPTLPIRRLFEPEAGLSRSRNRAIEAAGGELILWTDDDVLVDEGWLESYARAALEWPDAAYFGGPIDPLFEAEPPGWIARNFRELGDAYAVLRLEGGTRPLAAGELVFGANLATRASALEGFRFDVRLGSEGSNKVGGDETDLQLRLQEAGRGGVWVDSASVRHFVPADRLNRRYLLECYRGRGRSVARVEGPEPCAHLLGYPRYAVRRYLGAWLSLARRWPGSPPWAAEFARLAHLEGFLAEARRRRLALAGRAS